LGDEGVHQKCGAEFWEELSKTMRKHFRDGKFTDGIVETIERAGNLLREHYPRAPDDTNELPDSVAHD